MARAKIDYEEIQNELLKMFPWPVYRSVRIRKASDYGGRTPTRIYDRSTGNYAPIGWSVNVELLTFTGEYRMNMEPVYEVENRDVLIVLS